jgi:nucleoside-diphosphate-sugar epimerase
MNDLASAIRLIIGNPAAAGRTYNVGSLFLTWEEIGTMMIQETNSRSAVQCIPSDQWHGPQFLNEVWDLSWDKAASELGYEPQASGTETRTQFREALKECIADVK